MFNTQYSENPESLPVKDILRLAFDKGVVALDTSPYYGQSEALIGQTLQELHKDWPRERYFICTKAGRIAEDQFDYSRPWVRKSVVRSIQRLHASYLDLVYMHDVEFVEEEHVYEALKELRQLKDEGIIRNFGISGYPVQFLLRVAQNCNDQYFADIGPLDAVLSYCHGCLQNTKLFDVEEGFFRDAGVRKLMNGSILSMSLLRSEKTHDFHPAGEELRAKVDSVARAFKNNGVELANLATRYAFRRSLFTNEKDETGFLKWDRRYSVVLGVSSVDELNSALKDYSDVKVDDHEEPLYAEFQAQLGHHFNETWSSGLPENSQ